MIALKNLSIKSKLTTIIMLTSCVALLAACMGFVAYELFTYRKNMVTEYSTLADVMGQNCVASLEFNRPDQTEKIIATLRAYTQVVSVCIYKEGKYWASFPSSLPHGQFPAVAPAADHRFEKNALILVQQFRPRQE